MDLTLNVLRCGGSSLKVNYEGHCLGPYYPSSIFAKQNEKKGIVNMQFNTQTGVYKWGQRNYMESFHPTMVPP